MSSSRLLAIVVALLAIGATVFFVFLRPDGEGGATTALAPGEGGDAGARGGDLPNAIGRDPSMRPPQQRSVQERAAVAGASGALVVQVVVPATAPRDPELEVVAVDASSMGANDPGPFLDELRKNEARAQAVRARVGADGSARIELPESMKEPVLLLDGRYLYLPRPVPVADASAPLKLEPVLGACVVVRLEPPGGEAVDGKLAIHGANFTRSMEVESRESPAVARDAVEFRALNAESLWTVAPTLESHAVWAVSGLELEPGELREVEVELMTGATVVGVVVDETGRGLAAVEVAIADTNEWMAGTDARATTTDADGRFELRAVPPGQQIFEAAPEGWVSARTEMMELADGERRDGLRLTLSRGLSIAGVVQRRDGSAAAGARVVIEARRQAAGFGGWGGPTLTQVGSASADADGAFLVGGLEEGAYSVRASLPVASGAGQVVWHGRAEGVSAGTRGLSVVLEGPIAFAGRVVNDLGEPVTSFELIARSGVDGGPEETQAFEDADGRFLFERAGPGEWELEARAEGHVQLESVAWTLPAQDGAELELILERRCVVAGVVVDSTGLPTPGASVQVNDGTPSANPWMGPAGPVEQADAEGRFRFDALRPGTVTLSAEAEGWAQSEELVLDVLPGEATEDAVLTLRVGGRIEGTLATDAGDPLSAKRVTWGDDAMGFASRGETRTDGAGRFTFEHVTPGDWAVSAAPSWSEISERTRGRRDDSAFIEAMGELVTATVTVVDGEVVEVYLGGEPKRPVRVFGTVTMAGAPLADATASAVSEESAIFQGMKSAQVAEDGSYELTLDRPGAYVLSARAGSLGVEIPVDVPRADEARFDLVVPLGGITGTVRAPGGGGAGGIRLSLQREDGLGRVRWGGDTATTDEQGSYAFEALEAGRYTVRANVAGWQGDAEKSFGTNTRSGVEVQADHTTHGIDFALQRAGTIEGIVRDPAGKPLAGASIFFRGEGGVLVTPVSSTSTDGRGQFRREGLAPGSYALSARAPGHASSQSATVSVREAESTKVELVLEVGTLIEIVLKEGEEEIRRARFEVFDEDGQEIAGMLTLADLQALFNEGVASLQSRLGPFPAGRYTVRATTADGRATERTVRLRGKGGSKTVRLKLDG